MSALDEVHEDDALICPACKGGRITAYFQVVLEVQPSGWTNVIEGPDSDSFLNAGCSNLECRVELKQEPGDGRLRRAWIYPDDEDDKPWSMGEHGDREEWARIATAYINAVEIILKRVGSS